MCGIFAIIGQSTNTTKDAQKLYDTIEKGRKQQRALRHRGPDWEGEYQWGRVYLAHHRLAIIDPESGGQPLVHVIEKQNSSKYITDSSRQDPKPKHIILTVNGEIYNYKQLRNDVDKLYESNSSVYTYKTNSDCEVIIPLYLYYTRHLVNLSGHDIKSRYHECLQVMLSKLEGMFSFVLHDEELDTTLIVRDPMGITSLYYGFNNDAIFHVASEMKAFVNEVSPQVFPAGHFMYFSRNIETSPTLVKYFHTLETPAVIPTEVLPSSGNSTHNMSIAEYCTGIRDRLIDAVDKRMQTDVPFGVLLSGGLDSSLITSIAVRIADGRIPSKYGITPGDFGRLTTFSIGLEGSPDLLAAASVAGFLNTRHHSLTFTLEEGVSAIHDLIYHLETYDVTTIRASAPMYLLARKIKSMGIKMVLSGEGSDELFGGYLYFLQAPSDEEHKHERIQRLANLQYADNLRANKSTMAWGVEARVPFEDTELVRYGVDVVPSELMRNKGVEKWILREAFYDEQNPWLPDKIVWRQKEQFSDGVGYSWIDELVKRATDSVTDIMLNLAPQRFPFNTPVNKEEYYYRSIFEELFPGKNWDMTVRKWIPRVDWPDVGYDPSGRAQKSHNRSYTNNSVNNGMTNVKSSFNLS